VFITVKSTEFVSIDKGRPGKGERLLSRLMLWGEDVFKIIFFRCQKCGECILSHTAFTCSQRCPKRLRNGPCGGTREGGYCEVYPEKHCIWFLIHKRADKLQRTALLMPCENIHNWRLEKTSAWLNVFTGRIKPPKLFPWRQRLDDLK